MLVLRVTQYIDYRSFSPLRYPVADKALKGKPVQIRRGPAAVSGDDIRNMPLYLDP